MRQENAKRAIAEHLDYLQYLERASDSDDSESRHSFVEATDMENYPTPYDGDHPRVNVYSEFMALLHGNRAFAT